MESIDVLRGIISAFDLAFEKTNNHVWTHEAMQASDFWDMQCLNAKKVLEKL